MVACLVDWLLDWLLTEGGLDWVRDADKAPVRADKAPEGPVPAAAYRLAPTRVLLLEPHKPHAAS